MAGASGSYPEVPSACDAGGTSICSALRFVGLMW